MHAEFSAIRDELRTESSAIRDEMRAESSAIRGELRQESSALREEMRAESSAIRGEGGEGMSLARLRDELREEIRDGDEETRRQMRVLHEDLVGRIALIKEGRPRRKKSDRDPR
jgi:hypothetical protein